MVKNGVDLVRRTGRSLEDIVAQVSEIDGNVAAIVEGAREQATGLKEINTAVNSMDQATQQNAAMAEESTAASAELAAQAAELRLALTRFDTSTSRASNALVQPRRGRAAA
jgi:methyl-accepting chemotaxis protein